MSTKPREGRGLLTRRLLLAGASTLGAAGTAWLVMRQLRMGVYALPTESDNIVDPISIDGRPVNLLRADLRDAQMIVPDRPHDPRDAVDPQARAAMTRRRQFTIDTTSQRLRGRVEAADQPRPRVLIVGDSVCFGWGVAHEQALGQRLSRALGLPVLNAGVPAMRPPEMGVWAHHLLGQLEVDLVLTIIRPRQPEIPQLAQAIASINQRTRARVGMVLSPLSTFDVRGGESRTTLGPAVQADIPGIPVLEATEPIWAQHADQGVVLRREDGMQRMIDLATGQVVVEAADQAERAAPGIIAAFEEDHSLREPFFFDGGHVDEAGSEVFAAAIADFVRREGLLPT